MGRAEPHYHRAMLNVRKLLDTWEMLGRRPLPPSFARQLLTLPKEESLEDWFRRLPGACGRSSGGRAVGRAAPRRCVEAGGSSRKCRSPSKA